MGRIDLVRDERTGFFLLPAFIVRTEIPQAPLEGSPFVPVTFYVDTGTNRSSISQSTAESLGLDLRGMECVTEGGVGGFATVPRLHDFTFWIQESSGPFRVHLAEATIMLDHVDSVTEKKGGFSRKRRRVLEAVSLFGLDGLAALRATLTATPHENQACITWS